jgi:hypothetical protein
MSQQGRNMYVLQLMIKLFVHLLVISAFCMIQCTDMEHIIFFYNIWFFINFQLDSLPEFYEIKKTIRDKYN